MAGVPSLIFRLDKVNIPRAREAVELYYHTFGTRNSLTINEAAEKCGVTGLEAHLYIAITEDLGMPETRKEAQDYLQRLLKSDRQPLY